MVRRPNFCFGLIATTALTALQGSPAFAEIPQKQQVNSSSQPSSASYSEATNAAATAPQAAPQSEMVKDSSHQSAPDAQIAAQAQSEVRAGTGNVPSALGSTGQDIVVTAQRRSQRLVDVPVTVTALSSNELRQAGTESIGSLSKVVPSLQLVPQAFYVAPVIRGVGAAISLDVESAVAIYVDGVYQPTETSNLFDLSSITSVQVLKGPQGTLFGRNATGGAILLQTADPTFTRTGKFEVSLGRFNEERASSYLNIPLTDTLAINGSIAYRHSDGYIKDLRTGEIENEGRSFIGRAKLLYQPTDKLRFILTAAYNDVNDPTLSELTVYEGHSPLVNVPGAGPVAESQGTLSHDVQDSDHSRSHEYNLHASWDLGFATLASISAIKRDRLEGNFDNDVTYLPVLALDFAFKTKVFTQEVTLTSHDNKPFTYVVGAYYFRDRAGFPTFLADGAPYFHERTKDDSLAGFADGTYKIGSLSIIGGIRYSSELRQQVNGLGPVFGPTDHVARVRENAWTPRVGLSYALDRSTNIYATYSKGFKSGVFGATQFTGTGTRPEKVDAFEGGVKHTSHFFSASISGYLQQYKDIQTNVFVVQNNVLTNNLVNAAKARIYGTEADVTFHLTPELDVRLAGAYNHGTYTSFTNAPTYVATSTGQYLPQTIDATGHPLINAPRVTLNASVNYRIELGSNSVTFNLSPSYASRVYYNFSSNLSQKPVSLLDGSITFATKDHLTLRAFGHNLTDKKYALGLARSQLGDQVTWNMPRTYGIALGYSF